MTTLGPRVTSGSSQTMPLSLQWFVQCQPDGILTVVSAQVENNCFLKYFWHVIRTANMFDQLSFGYNWTYCFMFIQVPINSLTSTAAIQSTPTCAATTMGPLQADNAEMVGHRRDEPQLSDCQIAL